MKIKPVKNIVFLFIFLVISCSQNMDTADLNFYKKTNNADYKACLSDANYNIEKIDNINQDRISVLQTDDTMIDFYNIENDINNIELSTKRNEMIDDCMKNRIKK